jgi:hypothetical protein
MCNDSRCTALHSRLPILSSWLFGQYIVDQYAKVGRERLRWYRDNQDDFRAAHYQGLAGANVADDGTTPDTYINRPSILLYSFTGGPQHMRPQFQDAMTIASRHGKLNLFIEFTRSYKWQRQPSISLRASGRRPP